MSSSEQEREAENGPEVEVADRGGEEADGEDRRKEFAEELLRSVDKYMESRTTTFEKKIEKLVKRSSQSTVQQATKKIKLETPDLSRPGCKDQFKHNVAVIERIEAAENHIKEAELKEALEELKEGKQLILKRQKLVQLADREESGWSFVKEYEKDELASGSADEKHMNRARATAARKARSKESRRSRYFKSNSSSNNTSFSRQRLDKYRHEPVAYNFRNAKSNFSEQTRNSRGFDFRRDRYDRQCFGCGKRGHLIYTCPESKARV